MTLIRTALIIFLLFISGMLQAFDSCIHIDITQAKTLPGWSALQELFFPDLALKTESKLQQQGMEFSVTDFSMLAEGDTFDLHLAGITEKQLDYLLRYKMLHPSWSWIKEKGVYTITGENNEKLTVHPTETGMRFFNGTIRQKVLQNYKKQKNIIVQGVLLCTDKKDQHPALSDVSIIYFYLRKENGKIVTDLFIRGEDQEKNDRIFRDLNIYFTTVYAEAAKKLVVDTNFFNIYKVSREKNWVRLRITLTPEQAKEFFEQFGAAMKEMLPR